MCIIVVGLFGGTRFLPFTWIGFVWEFKRVVLGGIHAGSREMGLFYIV